MTCAPDRPKIAALIDHTLLSPQATPADIRALVDEAAALGVHSVCLSPSLLPLDGPTKQVADRAGLAVAAVIGFPSGAHKAAVKAFEAQEAVAAGADELDMVVNLSFVMQNNWHGVEEEIATVRKAAGCETILKVILETALFTDDQIIAACRAAEAAGADFVKTSTGFHPAGGATVEAVALMRKTVENRLGVKASGGIRTAEQALALIAAGANRLGLSASAQVLNGL